MIVACWRTDLAWSDVCSAAVAEFLSGSKPAERGPAFGVDPRLPSASHNFNCTPFFQKIKGDPRGGVRFKMGALFCVPGRLKSGASGLRPADGLRRPGRRRATVGAKRLQSLSSLGQCTIRQIAPKLKRPPRGGDPQVSNLAGAGPPSARSAQEFCLQCRPAPIESHGLKDSAGSPQSRYGSSSPLMGRFKIGTTFAA